MSDPSSPTSSLTRVLEVVRPWIPDHAPTRGYAELMFAYGFAANGESTLSQQLYDGARVYLDVPPQEDAPGRAEEVSGFLLEAFRYRITAAQQGRLHEGPLSPELLARRARTDRITGYFIDRFRHSFRLIEPDVYVDPYLDWGAKDSLGAALNRLNVLSDPAELDRTIRGLWEKPPANRGAPNRRLLILTQGLLESWRLPLTSVTWLLSQVISSSDALKSLEITDAWIEQVWTLRTALRVAGRRGVPELMPALLEILMGMLAPMPDLRVWSFAPGLVGECLRSLYTLGLHAAIEPLLQWSEPWIEQAEAQVKGKESRLESQIVLYQAVVAEGWMLLGRCDRAMPLLQRVSQFLRLRKLGIKEQHQLACAYVCAWSHAPHEAVASELVQVIPEIGCLRDQLQSAPYYLLLVLQLVEATVMSFPGVSPDSPILLHG